MSAPLLVVHGLGKAFRDYGSEWRRFASWFGIRVPVNSESWVLRDIAFSVSHGESIGIVGQNGAGKSTLLKLITGTLRPTKGSIGLNGRIAAILELGMGFNPDLSGRANVYHSAGLMGFSRQAIDGAINEIELFAEIGEYFEEPARTYSTGMQMRVAFAVATAFRPDLLIVDEALSVGDAYFQHKCFKRIREFRDQGTSLLVVSHDTGAIQNLCDRALLLEGGVLIKDGDPTEVMDLYNALIAERENATVRTSKRSDGRVQTVSGTGEAVVEEIVLRDSAGKAVEFVDVGESVSIEVTVRTLSDIPRLVLGYMIKDRLGQTIFGTNTYHTKQILENLRSGQRIQFSLDFVVNLGPGSYSVSTALVSSDTHLVNNYEWRDLAIIFNVANMSRPVFIGSSWIPPVIEVLPL